MTKEGLGATSMPSCCTDIVSYEFTSSYASVSLENVFSNLLWRFRLADCTEHTCRCTFDSSSLSVSVCDCDCDCVCVSVCEVIGTSMVREFIVSPSKENINKKKKKNKKESKRVKEQLG